CSLNVRRDTTAALVARERQRPRRAPAKARAEERCLEHGLNQHRFHGVRMQELEDLREGEAVLLTERQKDSVIRRRGLQLEVEGPGRSACAAPGPGRGGPARQRARAG